MTILPIVAGRAENTAATSCHIAAFPLHHPTKGHIRPNVAAPEKPGIKNAPRIATSDSVNTR